MVIFYMLRKENLKVSKVNPIKNQKNRNIHNWLIYQIIKKNLINLSSFYKGTLVDLGCGESPYKDFFLQYVDNYIGIDWANSFHNSNADITSNLNKRIELCDNFADTLISFSVIEHLCEPQIFLNESYRVLKNNGVFILQVPWQWHVHEAPYDYFRYTPYGLQYMFKKAGFTEVDIIPQSGFFTTSALKLNYFLARLIYKLPKIIMYFFAILLLPIWTITQMLAPLLDKIDKEWERETVGFIVIAKKKYAN